MEPERTQSQQQDTPPQATAVTAAVEIEILAHRSVPLGGPRAMPVRRTLPQRARSTIGAWCFLDHFGQDEPATHLEEDPADHVADADDAPPVPPALPSMHVPPHPHIGLQTVTWLFKGQIEHRDSVGSVQTVLPGQLNLMSAGRGVSHSEVAPPARRPLPLEGVQLWTALPDTSRHGAPFFEHHQDLPVVELDGARITIILGGLAGVASPATIFSPLVCAQIELEPGASVQLALDPQFEYGFLPHAHPLLLDDHHVPARDLAYVAPGRRTITLTDPGTEPADKGVRTVVLIGGEPFTEDLLMWWNFVGRTHEEILQARHDWQSNLTRRAESADPTARFGRVEGYRGAPLPAPSLPEVRLRPRRRARS